jgi:hypothetical protein
LEPSLLSNPTGVCCATNTLEPPNGSPLAQIDSCAMASDLAPVAYQQWDFEKAQTTHSSPSSDTSASEFFDAEDKLRITPNMDEIREALAVESKPVFNKEYLSSEEALSPVVDDGTSEEEEDEEESEAELEVAELVEVDLWEEIRVFALDIAIT